MAKLTPEQKAAAKAARLAKNPDAGQNPAPVAAESPQEVDRSWEQLGYTDPKTGVNLVLAVRPDTEKAKMMARFLAAQPRVLTIVPCDEGEKPGVAVKRKTMNGFMVDIVKGVYVQLPQPMVDELAATLSDTTKAVNPQIAITDPITKKVKYISANLDNQSPSDSSKDSF